MKPFTFRYRGETINARDVVMRARKRGILRGPMPGLIVESAPKPPTHHDMVLSVHPGACCARVSTGLYMVWKKSQGGTKRDPKKAIGQGRTPDKAWREAWAKVGGDK